MQQLEQQTVITRKIGSTTYVVSVRFSDAGKESFSDKLLRIVKADDSITDGKEAAAC
jgi:hypothetical protein